MLVFHGGIEPISDPHCDYNNNDDLDFGHGFYVTDSIDEAAIWAHIKAELQYAEPFISAYVLDDNYIYDSTYLVFEDTDDEWFDFFRSL